MENNEKQKDNSSILVILIKTIIIICIVVFLIPIIPYLLIVEIIFRIEFQIFSMRTKKKVILINSDSPIWHDYIFDNIVPLFGDKVLTLNWSQRNVWDKSKWEVKAFNHWGGNYEYNPLIIINNGFFQIKVIRLYEAFAQYKHGKESELQKKELEIHKAIRFLKK